MIKPQKTQCIEHILEFYIGNGKGVVTARSIPVDPSLHLAVDDQSLYTTIAT